MSKNSEESNDRYLPERYRQKIKAKKQLRIIKKILAACGVIAVFAGLYLVFGGILFPPMEKSPLTVPVSPSPSSTTSATITLRAATDPTPAFSRGSGMSRMNSTNNLPLDSVIALLRWEYPVHAYMLTEVNLTDRYGDLNLYEFRIQPVNSLPGTPSLTVFFDAANGKPYTPGQERSRISGNQAEDRAKKAFVHLPTDHVIVRYSESPDTVRSWNFTLMKENLTLAWGTLDPDTGQLQSFRVPVKLPGRPVDSPLSMPAALRIAERFITDNNGPVAVKLDPLGSPNETVAGQFVFIFNRIVQDIPCDGDGFTVVVDPVSGEVTEYDRHWNTPENAFPVASEPLVTRHEATFAILQKAQEKYPGLKNDRGIISAEIRWHDQHPPGSIPRPGSVPLTWRVQFDDEIMRAGPEMVPALGWVDAQTGNILDFQYQH